MAFGSAPGAPAAPAKPPVGPAPKTVTLAEASAAGTTEGAPTPLSMGAAPGTGLPGTNNPAPQAPPAAPSAGGPPANPPVAPHNAQRSVGTHQSRSPNKRGNPTFGMSK